MVISFICFEACRSFRNREAVQGSQKQTHIPIAKVDKVVLMLGWGFDNFIKIKDLSAKLVMFYFG